MKYLGVRGRVNTHKDGRSDRVPFRRLSTLDRKQKIQYAIYAVLLVLAVSVSFIALKMRHVTQLKTVADNAVVREYRDKLPKLKAEAKEKPGSFDARRAYGQALYVTGDKEAAKTEYEAAAEINSKDASIQNNLGNTYRDLKDYASAETAYRKAYELDPSMVNAYVNLATMQAYTLKKPADAVATYKIAVTKNGQSPDLLILLGGAYEQNSQKDLALSAYRNALSKDPANTAAKQNVERLTK